MPDSGKHERRHYTDLGIVGKKNGIETVCPLKREKAPQYRALEDVKLHYSEAEKLPDLLAQSVPEGMRLVTTDLISCENDGSGNTVSDPVTAFRLALTDAATALFKEGAAPQFLTEMALVLPDTAPLADRLLDYDLAFRETLGGNFPQIIVVADETAPGPLVALSAVVPTAENQGAVYADFSQVEINFQYSPRAQAPDHDKFFELWRTSGPAYQENRTAEIWFGETPGQSFDLFMPDGVDTPPLHLFIHGGYWQALDKRNHAHMADALLKAGLAVAMVNYDLMPDVDLTEILRQCRAAVAKAYNVADQFGYDKSKMTVSGHSAGGHLSGALACTDWKAFQPDLPDDILKGAVPISGLFDLEPLSKTGMQRVFQFGTGDIADLSPINMVPPVRMPIVLSVGGLESSEFHRQTALFADHMRHHGCSVSEAPMDAYNHFSIVEALTDPSAPLTQAIIAMAKGNR